MQYSILPNGVLRITAGNHDRAELARSFDEGGYYRAEAHVIDQIVGNGLNFVAPEHIGALTEAPIFSDGFGFNDEGVATLEASAKLWWFPEYQMRDPWAALRDTGRVEFAATRLDP